MNIAERLFTAKGDLSSVRVVFVGISIFVIAVPITAWAIVYIVHDGACDIPAGVVSLASIVFLTITGGKYLEKKEENVAKKEDNIAKEEIRNDQLASQTK